MTQNDTLRTVRVELGVRSYDVVIGEGALPASADALSRVIGSGRAAVVADETVWGLHASPLRALLPDAPVLTVPSGEASKSFAQYERITEWLLAAGVGRDGTVVAFGGGVTGDLAGFCAATLRRGCRFVQVPTTLLAMVDSSVGGKTAINARAGKNLVGAFHQPGLVVADTAFLGTLPERERRAGLAEIVKAAIIDGEDFAGSLEAGAEEAALIARAVALKARIVAEDEREGGVRALLNLGHTFGHAVEAAYGYDGRVLHGEAVGLGMAMAARFAEREGLCDAGTRDRITALAEAQGLPVRAASLPAEAGLTPDALLAAMRQDKKVEGGALTLVLPRAIGEVHVRKGVREAPLRAFLEADLS